MCIIYLHIKMERLTLKKIIKILSICLLAFTFIACQNNQNEIKPQSQWGEYQGEIFYDYYEIADDEIVHTSINDTYNALNFQASYINNSAEYMTFNSLIIDEYNLQNKALDKNETFMAQKNSRFNTFTNKSLTTISKANYGTYEMSANYCVINSDIDNCKTYIYYRH